MSEIPQAPAPSLDARGQWLTPECQHTIPELLRLAARHINPLAAAFVRDVHAAADRLDAAPSAPSDALREAWIKGCLEGRAEAARLVDSYRMIGQPSVVASRILALPAPTAPKATREQGDRAALKCRCGALDGNNVVDAPSPLRHAAAWGGQ